MSGHGCSCLVAPSNDPGGIEHVHGQPDGVQRLPEVRPEHAQYRLTVSRGAPRGRRFSHRRPVYARPVDLPHRPGMRRAIPAHPRGARSVRSRMNLRKSLDDCTDVPGQQHTLSRRAQPQFAGARTRLSMTHVGHFRRLTEDHRSKRATEIVEAQSCSRLECRELTLPTPSGHRCISTGSSTDRRRGTDPLLELPNRLALKPVRNTYVSGVKPLHEASWCVLTARARGRRTSSSPARPCYAAIRFLSRSMSCGSSTNFLATPWSKSL